METLGACNLRRELLALSACGAGSDACGYTAGLIMLVGTTLISIILASFHLDIILCFRSHDVQAGLVFLETKLQECTEAEGSVTSCPSCQNPARLIWNSSTAVYVNTLALFDLLTTIKRNSKIHAC